MKPVYRWCCVASLTGSFLAAFWSLTLAFDYARDLGLASWCGTTRFMICSAVNGEVPALMALSGGLGLWAGRGLHSTLPYLARACAVLSVIVWAVVKACLLVFP